MATRFAFDSKGIGNVLREGRMTVPPNQRSYAWEEGHVRTFLEDLSEATQSPTDDYFLGTLVLVQAGDALPSIADGQQRLATTTILLARIRDYLFTNGREASARSIDMDFIRSIDRDTETQVARLSLNLEDNDYFSRAILCGPMDSGYEDAKSRVPVRASNIRLKEASDRIAAFIGTLVEQFPLQARATQLLRWVTYVQNQVDVVIVRVPDEIGAYRMFETLNDRGLKASQADILKNYFCSRSATSLTPVIAAWTAISAAVEALGGDENERLLTYIRHLWITIHGPTKEKELAAEIRKRVTSETRTLEFVSGAAAGVQDYLALWSADHPKWQAYKPFVRQNIETLSQHLQVEQIRPLLFAVARHFTPEETDKALRLFVSWSVRFLIYGGRGGLLDSQYSMRAQEVGTKKITKASELREAMKRYVPTDAEFEQAFATARVSRPYLARYYLRAIEKTLKDDPQPEYVANEEVSDINLEHVLPLTPSKEWGVDAESAKAAQRLLGNMALLKAKKNRDVANKSFREKRTVFAESGYYTTNDIAKYDHWTIEEIRQRQLDLAKLAAKTWPLTFGE